jgi:putative chitinase
MITFDRKIYFEAVRQQPFGGKLKQDQVDGQELLLAAWENQPRSDDLRHFSYMLATTFHETAATMRPIEEYGKGKGHTYGKVDPETKQTYYGRGYVQLTWRDNYRRATDKLHLTGADDLEWHASRALDSAIAWQVMSRGMMEGWFTGKSLPQYFDVDTNDPVGARAIINPDKLGKQVAGYHGNFLAALQAAAIEAEPPVEQLVVTVRITAPAGVTVKVEQIEG